MLPLFDSHGQYFHFSEVTYCWIIEATKCKTQQLFINAA
jgi:hypothetical protein